MIFQQDPLFDIFKREIDSAMFEAESDVREEEIIARVVKSYMDLINKKGFVPTRLYSFLEQDVREDVTHMLKKTTYGYFNFSEYKRHHPLSRKFKKNSC